MSNHDRISTGSLGEKIIMRTSSTRGSVRETLTKAIRSTLRRTVTEKFPNTNSVGSTSLTRSASSSASSIAQKSSSGFGSMSHLPPTDKLSMVPSGISQSMYTTKHLHCCQSKTSCCMSSSPSLTTLKDFGITDFDDTKSTVSSASTSRITTKESFPRRYKSHNLRTFLSSPVRLRRRDPSKNDAFEAGFEPPSAVPRCNSTSSLSFSNSQFQPSDLTRTKNEIETRVYTTPTAVVGPRKGHSHRQHHGNACGMSYNKTEERNMQEHYRRSLQALNSSCPYNLSNTSYSEWPSGALPITDDMDGGQNTIKNNSSTPQSQRRSVQYNSRLSSSGIPHFNHTVVTSTPLYNKVAVAPQPQTHKSRHLSHNEVERDLTRNNQHVVPSLERRESNAGVLVLSSYQPYLVNNSDERLVDGPPSPKDLRVASLEQRVKELETMVVGSGQTSTSLVIPVTPTSQAKHGHNRSSVGPPTQLIISNSSPTSSMTQQLMAKEVVIKEVEIERLQAKLRKTYAQMERQQLEYNEEVRRFTKDSETAKAELLRVVNKLNELEAESNKYREKTTAMDSAQNSVFVELQSKFKHQEKELLRLRSELAEKERLEKAYNEVKQQLEYLELQNETLNKTLDEKEGVVKELEQNIVSMRMEATLYHQSCSSGSTPLADETESLADIRPPLYSSARPYTKAHSTLGANLSPLPTPKSGLTKSLSNYAIDSNRRDDVSSSMSRCLRSQQKKLVDSRLMVKCIKETVERLAKGENPDISRLLGIKTDSMSESETEQVAFDSTAMTMGVAEKMMRRQEEGMCRLEKDLDAIRYLVQDYYQAKVGDTLTGSDDACRIQ